MGPNGSGKSTLGKIVSGMVRPDTGSVRLPGRGFLLLQRPGNMMFRDTVKAELSSLPGGIRGDVMDKLGLSELLDHHPFSLSVGERQRLGIAMVLGSGAVFAVLDEPFKGLDPSSLSAVQEILDSPDFPPYIVISNDTEAAHSCPRLVVMDRGRVLFDGDPDDILSRDEVYDMLGWPIPGNLLVARSAGIQGTPNYHALTEALAGAGSP
jgi:energy-coupling factor transporter ATP-binding protein EcfA2